MFQKLTSPASEFPPNSGVEDMNPEHGLDPLAFELYAGSDDLIGNFTFVLHVRVKLLEMLDHIVFSKQVNVEIQPCIVVDVKAYQQFNLEIVSYL